MFNNPKKKSEDVKTPTEDVKETKKEWKGNTYNYLLTAMKQSQSPFKLESHSVDEVKSKAPETKSEELEVEKVTKKVRSDLSRKK